MTLLTIIETFLFLVDTIEMLKKERQQAVDLEWMKEANLTYRDLQSDVPEGHP
jgi:hypothetical protein